MDGILVEEDEEAGDFRWEGVEMEQFSVEIL